MVHGTFMNVRHDARSFPINYPVSTLLRNRFLFRRRFITGLLRQTFRINYQDNLLFTTQLSRWTMSPERNGHFIRFSRAETDVARTMLTNFRTNVSTRRQRGTHVRIIRRRQFRRWFPIASRHVIQCLMARHSTGKTYLVVLQHLSMIRSRRANFKERIRRLTFRHTLPFNLPTLHGSTTSTTIQLAFNNSNGQAFRHTLYVSFIVNDSTSVVVLKDQGQDRTRIKASQGTKRVILLLLNATPRLTTREGPNEVRKRVHPVHRLRRYRAIIGIVNESTFSTTSHRHRNQVNLGSHRARRESRHTNGILTCSTTINMIRLHVVRHGTLTFTRNSTYVASVVNCPVNRCNSFLRFNLFSLCRFIRFLLDLKRYNGATMYLIRIIGPRQLVLPFQNEQRRRLQNFIGGVRRVKLFPREGRFIRNGHVCLSPILVAR